MSQFIGYTITAHGEGTPISTGATKDDAMTLAITRTLSLPVNLDGEIAVRENESLSEDEFAQLTGSLDKFFAERGIK